MQVIGRLQICLFSVIGVAGPVEAQVNYTPYNVSTYAGIAGNAGSADGTGSAASFFAPAGLAIDANGNLYVSDVFSNTIRKIDPGGVVTTLAGTPGVTGSKDGTGPAAQFNYPGGVAVDVSGNVYVADTQNNTIRRITPAGVMTTLAGTPALNYPHFSEDSYRCHGYVTTTHFGCNIVCQLSAHESITTTAG
jgi:sugar lactone lactonase YvrE